MAILEQRDTRPFVSAQPGTNNKKTLAVFFYGKPFNPLQAAVVDGFRDYLGGKGAIVQKKPNKQTNLIVTPVEMSKDIPVQDLALLRLGGAIDRYQTKVISIATLPHIPTEITEVESDHLAKVLDVSGRNRDELIALAQERHLSPIVATGYPQLPLAGSSYAWIVEGDENSTTPTSSYLIGLEQSHPKIGAKGGFYADLYSRLAPQALSEMVIANNTMKDIVLPYPIWLESTAPEDIILAGQKMQELDLYPPPFPLKNFIGFFKNQFYRRFLLLSGLSFGNTSRRALGKELQYGKFWMSRSGAKKDALERTEVYLATGLILGTNIMGRAMVEKIRQDGRMSVDAIESEIIYDAYEDINATAHGHVDVIDPTTGRPFKQFSGFREVEGTILVCTDEQYGCGSKDLGRITAAALAQSPDKARTIVIQKRHGINSMGRNYPEMFTRIKRLRDLGLITTEIPQDFEDEMAA